MDQKLAAFFAKIKKLVTDYMAYCDMVIRQTTKNAEAAQKAAESVSVTIAEDGGIIFHFGGVEE